MRPNATGKRRIRRGLRTGYTLVSVIVAVVLLVVGVAALARTQMMAIVSQRGDAGRGQALALASAYMEELRAREASTVVTEAIVNIDSLGTVAVSGRFKREVVVTSDAINLKRVTVKVTPPGTTQSVNILTLFYVRSA